MNESEKKCAKNVKQKKESIQPVSLAVQFMVKNDHGTVTTATARAAGTAAAENAGQLLLGTVSEEKSVSLAL